jgi:LmeA-like phospholipid-binding
VQSLSPKTSGIISSVLSSACAAWLRTQVSEVQELQVQIVAGDRQMLSGLIPSMTVAAHHIVYRGVALRQIELIAGEIAVNLKQIVRGKPLQLLQPVVLNANALMLGEDFHRSLAAPFVANALTELVKQILASSEQPWSITWQTAMIEDNRLCLAGQIQQDHSPSSISIQMGMELVNSRTLRFAPLLVSCPANFPGSDLEAYDLDLGDQFNLKALQLQAGELRCQGEILVNP